MVDAVLIATRREATLCIAGLAFPAAGVAAAVISLGASVFTGASLSPLWLCFSLVAVGQVSLGYLRRERNHRRPDVFPPYWTTAFDPLAFLDDHYIESFRSSLGLLRPSGHD